MLKNIEIQNYAIIDKLSIGFTDGLTIITGETGAGKSILLGALELIRGKRADSKVLYNQDIKCYVEATFDVKVYDLKSYFEDEGIDYHDEMIIRREIAPNGKSRAFVNDSPVTLDVLQVLAEQLVDIHQQFDTLDIQKPAFQMQILDALADNKALLAEYSTMYKSYRQTLHNYNELIIRNQNANQEIEFLNFQMQEFHQANLKEGELEQLESILQKLTASEDIKKIHALLGQVLEDNEYAVNNQIQSILNQYTGIKDLDSTYSSLYDRIFSVREELKDIAKEAMRIYESTDYDEEMIQSVSQRLNTINRMLKKHNVNTLDLLLEISADIQSKLEGYSDLTSHIQELQSQITDIESKLGILAEQLSNRRKKVITDLENNVHSMLVVLSMEHAFIKVSLDAVSNFTPTGKDEVTFLFSPNKGSAFLPLKDTVSGGEMSRLTLCIKSLVAGALTLPTLILDEIDAGISGDVAQKMGGVLADMAKSHQIICITHSPQIAAKAQTHYWVHKYYKEHRTVTAIRQLSTDERIIEIAKMLSGNPPTETAKANARELIGI